VVFSLKRIQGATNQLYILPMVLTLDDSSAYDAIVRTEIVHLICLRHFSLHRQQRINFTFRNSYARNIF